MIMSEKRLIFIFGIVSFLLSPNLPGQTTKGGFQVISPTTIEPSKDITTTTVVTPTVVNPTSTSSPLVINPLVESPKVSNSTIESPTIENPKIIEPSLVINPTIVEPPKDTTPTVVSPTIVNPTTTQSPLVINPTIVEPPKTPAPTNTIAEPPLKKSFFKKVVGWFLTGDKSGNTEQPVEEGFFRSVKNKVVNFFSGDDEDSVAEKTAPPDTPPLIPPEAVQKEPIVDLLTCPSGSLVLEPLSPTTRQSWWTAFLALIDASAQGLSSDPKDTVTSLQETDPKGKTILEQRMNAGTLPRQGTFSKWDESLQKLVPLAYRCPVFTGVGEGSLSYGVLQRDGTKVIHPAPSHLFTPDYMVTIVSQGNGTRTINMDPTSVNIFKGTEVGGRLTPNHGDRAQADREVCPAGIGCITGRIRSVQCTCNLDPNRYPYEDNSVILSAEDPCGIAKLLDSRRYSGGGVLNLTQYPSGVLSQVKDAGGNLIAQCDVFDGPVNPHDIKAMTCGNLEEYLAANFQWMNGLLPPTSAPTPPPPIKGLSPDGQIDPSGLPAAENKCPAGGVAAPDRVAEVMNRIAASAVALPNDVINVVPPYSQVNMTAFPEGTHTFDIYEKGRQDQPWGDVMLYNLAIVPTLQAISVHLSTELAQGRFGPLNNVLAPGTGSEKRIVQTENYPHAAIGVLYYLERIIEELSSGRLRVAWGDLKELSSLSYYHAPSRTVILDNSLSATLTRVLLLATPYTNDPDIKVLANVSSVIGPLVHAATHHVLLEDDLTLQFDGTVPKSPSPFLMSIIPQPSGEGDWTPLPENESPCRGLYFGLDRGRCEFDTGYLNSDTCVPQKVGGDNGREILQGEAITRFVSLLIEYYLPDLEDTKLKMMCSLGPYIATCDQTPPPPGPEICTYTEGGILRKCTRDGESQYPACRVDDQGYLYDSSGRPARNFTCAREAPRFTPCQNPACQRLSSEGTCRWAQSDFSALGLIDGLLCDSKSGGLVGTTSPGGTVIGLRPENYFKPGEGIHNLLVQGRANEALMWAGKMSRYRARIPKSAPAPNIMGDIQSLQ